MTNQRYKNTAFVFAFSMCAVVVAPPAWADDVLPESNVVMRALADELARSMDLRMEDLEKPYFIQYTVEDTIGYQLAASYGALTYSDRKRSRDFYSQVRAGNYELDNTNFSGDQGFFFRGRGGGGGRATLPIEEDYQAIRQAIWWATDGDYKEAVETLTKKRAYMRDKNIADRPHDFSKAEVVEHTEPGAKLSFDKPTWEENLRALSARFKKYDQIQDSQVQLLVAAANTYIANSEGTRLRKADLGVLLTITAEVQAEDGMRISDSLTYAGPTTADLPPLDGIRGDIDEMVGRLTKVRSAPILEQYTGPVLFDARASAPMFKVMLARGVAGRVDPVGTQRRSFQGADNLEKKIGQRILPRSFRVFDDPSVERFNDKHLFGHYSYDDEGVKGGKVDVVVKGELRDMVMSRVPTKKLSGTNGHARRVLGGGAPQTTIGTLFIEDGEGISDAELKARLIEMAKDEGLEYGLRIASLRSLGFGSTRADIHSFFTSMQRGRKSQLGDPIYAYKVYVDDGHEELVRGCEFGALKVRDLKDIVAAGHDRTVCNYIDLTLGGASPAASIVAPPVLFEELELAKIEQEHDKLPILKTPATR